MIIIAAADGGGEGDKAGKRAETEGRRKPKADRARRARRRRGEKKEKENVDDGRPYYK